MTRIGIARNVFGIIALVFSALPAAGHPDLIEQIVGVSRQLAERKTAALYLQRADLFRRHGEFESALADIAAAERFQTNSTLQLDRARVLFDAGRVTNAFQAIQAFLQNDPEHCEALIIRARCQAKLGCAECAIVDYTS